MKQITQLMAAVLLSTAVTAQAQNEELPPLKEFLYDKFTKTESKYKFDVLGYFALLNAKAVSVTLPGGVNKRGEAIEPLTCPIDSREVDDAEAYIAEHFSTEPHPYTLSVGRDRRSEEENIGIDCHEFILQFEGHDSYFLDHNYYGNSYTELYEQNITHHTTNVNIKKIYYSLEWYMDNAESEEARQIHFDTYIKPFMELR